MRAKATEVATRFGLVQRDNLSQSGSGHYHAQARQSDVDTFTYVRQLVRAKATRVAIRFGLDRHDNLSQKNSSLNTQRYFYGMLFDKGFLLRHFESNKEQIALLLLDCVLMKYRL